MEEKKKDEQKKPVMKQPRKKQDWFMPVLMLFAIVLGVLVHFNFINIPYQQQINITLPVAQPNITNVITGSDMGGGVPLAILHSNYGDFNYGDLAYGG